ncbi:hypothetical protein BaRGS_00023537 [Batillaria attramentaria]|uniref:Uncharacterized protein n=1 Tax=Batillaria attramentaria TaxID=370345 RepID=A0ABD0KE47_9CAEN
MFACVSRACGLKSLQISGPTPEQRFPWKLHPRAANVGWNTRKLGEKRNIAPAAAETMVQPEEDRTEGGVLNFNLSRRHNPLGFITRFALNTDASAETSIQPVHSDTDGARRRVIQSIRRQQTEVRTCE